MINVDDFEKITEIKYMHPKLGVCFLRDGQTLDEFVFELNNPEPVATPTQDEMDDLEIRSVLKSIGSNDRAMLIAIYRLTKEVWRLRGLTPPTPNQFLDVMKSYKRGAIE